MNLEKAIGMAVGQNGRVISTDKLIQYINLKLTALGHPIYGDRVDPELYDVARPLMSHLLEDSDLLSDYHCPADQRIQDFLNDYLKDVLGKEQVKLPVNAFVLDRHGLARTMSLPPICIAKFPDPLASSTLAWSWKFASGLLI